MQRILLSIALIIGAGSAQAATLTTAGATDVDVGGVFYDINFVVGTCIAVFDGCDAVSDFTFQTEASAIAASVALLALIDNTPSIDADPRVTGCTDSTSCLIFTPWSLTDPDAVPSKLTRDRTLDAEDGVDQSKFWPVDSDLALNSSATWAVWSASTIAPVPVPAALPLLLTGLAGIAGLRRRQSPAAKT